MQRRDYKVSHHGLALRITEWGDVNARPVVMLHGIRGYAETFAVLAQALQPQHRVIAYDQRGRGDSDWDPACNYHTRAYVDDLHAVTIALGLEHFDLLGHSMGGLAAIAYAGTHPDRVSRLIIEDAGPGAFENSAGAMRIREELSSAPRSFASWDDAVEFMRRLRPSVTPEAREERLRNMLRARPDGGFTWRYDHDGIAHARLHPDPSWAVDLWPYVDQIACPTLVLRGGRSDYLKLETLAAMQARNPRISWVDVQGAGHYVHDDQPEVVAGLVRDFLVV